MLDVTEEQKVLIELLCKKFINSLEELNIGQLFELFQRHKLFPIASEIIPLLEENEKKQWKNAIQNCTLGSMHLSSMLGVVIGDFRNEGIEAISLKGPVLAYSLYGDIGKRNFGDLDLLVQREDVERVIELANGIGYELIHPKQNLSQKRWNYYFKYKKDVGLANRDNGVFIELHIGIYYHELLKSSQEELLWQDLSEEVIGGTPVKCMNKDNTFLYLTYHGGQHQYSRLFWLRDVAEVIRRWELDHQKILENAKSLGIERLLGVSLELVKEFFDVEVPSDYVEYLEEDETRIQKLKQLCINRILGPEELNVMGKLRRHYYLLLLKSGIKYKWAVINSIFHRWYIRKFLGGH